MKLKKFFDKGEQIQYTYGGDTQNATYVERDEVYAWMPHLIRLDNGETLWATDEELSGMLDEDQE